MRKMLINATQPEETRIAITENDKLFDIDIEHVDHEQKKANIYKATISRVEPSLNAVFVSYGEEKNGFLPAKEIAPEYFTKKVNPDENLPPLNEILKEGQEIIIQINKEERGTKGAALTTFLTLAGCYVVLMPNNPSAGGISRRIEGKERQALKTLIDSLSIPEDMGVIVRTAGVDRTPEEIQWDLNILLNLWEAIKKAADTGPAPFLIHRESDITMRAIRDYLRDDIDEIIVDTDEGFQDLSRQIAMLRPDFLDRLTKLEGNTPLFSKYHIESQIENAYHREVRLPSGGSIVIDTTEALTAIDVNSSRSTKRGNIEDTALHTNIEAAEEAARQIRLRDIGGLIIIDFIDMENNQNQKQVENQLADNLQRDRAKIHLTRISKFGLVEISRQRLSSSLDETSTIACPRCEGQGIIRSVQSLGLSILRLIEEEALKEKTNEVRVQLPITVSTFLLNEKRNSISELEQKLNIKIVLIPNSNLDTPHYKIQRIWGDVYSANKPSHDLIEPNNKDADAYSPTSSNKNKKQQPAIRSIQMSAAPQNQNEGFFSKLVKSIFGSNNEKQPKQNETKKQTKSTQQNNKPTSRNNNTKNQQNSQNTNKTNNRNNRYKNDNNKSAKPKYSNSNRTNIHKSEDLIDLSNRKKQTNEPSNKPVESTPKPTGLKVTPLTYSPKSNNKQKSSDQVSQMVKDILANSSSIANDTATQVETNETEKSNTKTKYLKFEPFDINQAKEKVKSTDDSNETNQPKPSTKDKKQTKDRYDTQEAYSPAMDPSSQGFVAEIVKNVALETKIAKQSSDTPPEPVSIKKDQQTTAQSDSTANESTEVLEVIINEDTQNKQENESNQDETPTLEAAQPAHTTNEQPEAASQNQPVEQNGDITIEVETKDPITDNKPDDKAIAPESDTRKKPATAQFDEMSD
jgi:ribonuclease E